MIAVVVVFSFGQQQNDRANQDALMKQGIYEGTCRDQARNIRMTNLYRNLSRRQKMDDMNLGR